MISSDNFHGDSAWRCMHSFFVSSEWPATEGTKNSMGSFTNAVPVLALAPGWSGPETTVLIILFLFCPSLSLSPSPSSYSLLLFSSLLAAPLPSPFFSLPSLPFSLSLHLSSTPPFHCTLLPQESAANICPFSLPPGAHGTADTLHAHRSRAALPRQEKLVLREPL